MISHPEPGAFARAFGHLIMAPWWFQVLGWLLTVLLFGKLTWDHVRLVGRTLDGERRASPEAADSGDGSVDDA